GDAAAAPPLPRSGLADAGVRTHSPDPGSGSLQALETTRRHFADGIPRPRLPARSDRELHRAAGLVPGRGPGADVAGGDDRALLAGRDRQVGRGLRSREAELDERALPAAALARAVCG